MSNPNSGSYIYMIQILFYRYYNKKKPFLFWSIKLF